MNNNTNIGKKKQCLLKYEFLPSKNVYIFLKLRIFLHSNYKELAILLVLVSKLIFKKSFLALQLGYLKTTRNFNSVHFSVTQVYMVVHVLLLLILFPHFAKCSHCALN